MSGLPPLRHAGIAGLRIGYREAGRGPALVFVHGMGGDSRNWESQYARFADRYRVVGWDAPGYGGSDDWPDVIAGPAAGGPSVADYVAAMAAFLEALGIDSAHLIGHSFGGTLMPAFHRKHPGRVLSLVLAQPVIGSGPLGAARQAGIIAERARLLDDLGVDAYARRHAPNSVAATADAATVAKGIEVTARTRPTGYLAQWRAMARADIFAGIAPPLPPTTVLAGGGDRTASRAVVGRIAAAIDGARLVELPDVGHMIYLEHPERFEAALEAHLAAL